jgi:DNA-binding transcriptional regulator YdaS (Cro superfamily)
MADDSHPDPFAALERAKAVVKGSSALARLLPGIISPQAISQWKRVPAERVLDVERATGVPRDELRPDIYPARPTADGHKVSS